MCVYSYILWFHPVSLIAGTSCTWAPVHTPGGQLPIRERWILNKSTWCRHCSIFYFCLWLHSFVLHSWLMSQQHEQMLKRLQIAIWGWRFPDWNVWCARPYFSRRGWPVNLTACVGHSSSVTLSCCLEDTLCTPQRGEREAMRVLVPHVDCLN